MADDLGLRFDTDADDYVAVTIRTTGNRIKTDKLISVSAVRVKEGRVADTLAEETDLQKVANFLKGELLVAQRAEGFTLKFLNKAMGGTLCNDYVDFSSFADVSLDGELADCRLPAVAAHFGMESPEGQSPLEECRLLQRCYGKLTEVFRAQWDAEDLYRDDLEAFQRMLADHRPPFDPAVIRNTWQYRHDGAQCDPLLRCCVLLPLIKFQLENDCLEEFLRDEVYSFEEDIRKGMYRRDTPEDLERIRADIAWCKEKLK